jgi:rare lipoprotein A
MAATLPAFGAALLPAFLISAVDTTAAEAKTPGKSYCYYGKCHRVKSIAETQALIGSEETISASFYDSCDKDGYNPCGLTSSGEVYRPDAADNAASPTYPDGTTLIVWSPSNGASVVLRVNNAGPYWGDRKLDVSRAAAEALGFAGEGVATLKVRVLSAPTEAEATYKERRRYDPVPGYIGQFASLEAAVTGAGPAFAIAALGAPLTTPQPQETVAQLESASIAAAAGGSALAATPVGSVAEIAPVRLAAAVTVAEGAVGDLAPEAARVASSSTAEKTGAHQLRVATAERVGAGERTQRDDAERLSMRNSRSQRVAAKRARAEKAVRVAAAVERAPLPKSVVTLDGTNDMSVFSRHTIAGMERLAPQEREPGQLLNRRSTYSALRNRERNDG